LWLPIWRALFAAGESELATAAGVNVMLAPEPFIAMAQGGFLTFYLR
jgi:acyl transferase domain-containing protein